MYGFELYHSNLNQYMELKILKAGSGDAILLSFDDEEGIKRNILIDCGRNKEHFDGFILPELEKIIERNENIDLVIITHIDQDHIKGFEYLFRDIEDKKTKISYDNILQVWFNSSYTNLVEDNKSIEEQDISYQEAKRIEGHLSKNLKDRWNTNVSFEKRDEENIKNFHGAKITIISPTLSKLSEYRDKLKEEVDISSQTDYNSSVSDTKEWLKRNTVVNDKGLKNASSIAFLFEYKDKSILFLGDAIPDIVEANLETILEEEGVQFLDLDFLKLSHHGSIYNIGDKFLDFVQCDNFIISTNGGNKHPNKRTLVKIITHPNNDDKTTNFYFNFDDLSSKIGFKKFEKQEYKFECIDSNENYGQKIKL